MNYGISGKIARVRDDRDGFTLVELIVVLVILAVLAALLIPALTGYIDDAKEQKIIAETRQVVMAAQTVYDKEYAKSGYIAELDESMFPAILERAEVDGTLEEITVNGITAKVIAIDADTGRVSELLYKSGGKMCRYLAEPETASPHKDRREMYNVFDAN